MITTMDIEQAEASVEEIRERTDQLQRTYGTDGGEAVERERRRLEGLREGKAKQDAALAVRTAAVKPLGAELGKLAAGLDKSASGVAEAAREASEALRRLMTVTEAHSATVAAGHARLVELDLPLVDEAVSQYETGAGERGVVCLAGRTYGPLGPDVLLAEVVGGLAREVVGPQHPLAQVTRTALHRVVAQGAAGRELLARLAQ